MPKTSDRSFLESFNVDLTMPKALADLDATDKVECDVCGRLILLWHFHTIGEEGNGLDMCNVCRNRFELEKKSAKGKATVVKVRGVGPTGRTKWFELSTTLRFYCVGRVQYAPQVISEFKGASLASLKKSQSYEANPNEVDEEEICNFNKGFDFTPLPKPEKKNTTSRKKPTENRSDVVVSKPKKGVKSERSDEVTGVELGSHSSIKKVRTETSLPLSNEPAASATLATMDNADNSPTELLEVEVTPLIEFFPVESIPTAQSVDFEVTSDSQLEVETTPLIESFPVESIPTAQSVDFEVTSEAHLLTTETKIETEDISVCQQPMPSLHDKEELMEFFDSLPHGYNVNSMASSVEAPSATSFSYDDDGKTTEQHTITCQVDQSVPMSQVMVGLRTPGVRMVSAAWVPTPSTESTDSTSEMFFSTLVQHPNYLMVWRLPLDSEGIGPAQCIYKAVLGKQASVGMVWVPLPQLCCSTTNRIGACTIIRERSVRTFMLPLNANASQVGTIPVISAEVCGIINLEPIHTAQWAPTIKSLDDLTLFVQLRAGSIKVFRHQRLEGTTLAQLASNVSDKLNMVLESTINPSGSIAANLHMAIGSVSDQLHVVWSSNSQIFATTRPFTDEGFSVRNVDESSTVVTALALAESGIIYSAVGAAIKLLKFDGQEKHIAEPIGTGINITSIVPLKASKSFLLGTSTNQLFGMKKATMSSYFSVAEVICRCRSDSPRSDAYVRTEFKAYASDQRHIEDDEASVLAATQWCAVSRKDLSLRQLALGFCPDGTAVVISCKI